MAEAVSYPQLRRRVYLAGLAMLAVVLISAGGYYFLGDGRWDFGDCLYMTVTTLATVGYGELLAGMQEVPYARAWTAGVILCGTGILLYWVSAFTAIIVEGDLRGTLRRRRMDKVITKLHDHVIICGAGTTGIHAVREVLATSTPFVVIDHSEQRLIELSQEYPGRIHYLVGEATDDALFEAAGIHRAAGVLVMLHDDRDNLFCTLTARSLNAKIRIVSKAVEHSTVPKLLRAGADRVVSSNFIGGMRLASELLRPTVVEFLDTMLRGDERLRIEEVSVPVGSHLTGKTLLQSKFRNHTPALVLAVRNPDGGYMFNPGASFVVEAGATFIVMARMEDVVELREQVKHATFG